MIGLEVYYAVRRNGWALAGLGLADCVALRVVVIG